MKKSDQNKIEEEKVTKKNTSKTSNKKKTTKSSSKKSSMTKKKNNSSKSKKVESKTSNKFSLEEKATKDGKFRLDILDILIIVVITSIISCVLTGFILNYQYRKVSNLYDKNIIKNENVEEFLKTYSEIVSNYYEEVDEKAMVEAAISGMLDFLEDNYSIYLDKNETDNLSEMLDSSYEGIGIVSIENIVYSVYKNSPAEKAGIKENDEIIKVNGIDISKENFDMISELILNSKEDKNELVVKRGNKELTFYVEKSTIIVPVTSTDVIKKGKKNIGYLTLSSFSSLSYEEFQESLLDLEKKGIDSLIIDLRNNSGGYLNSSYDIASLFLAKGKIVYSLENKNNITTYKDKTNDKRDYKIVVLVNGGTASASEILAAALHDSYGATIVGNTTYGKGKVQTMMYYEETMMKYTSAKWLRPNGECVDEVGIIPDYEIDLEIKNGIVYDKQLDKAIELLS